MSLSVRIALLPCLVVLLLSGSAWAQECPEGCETDFGECFCPEGELVSPCDDDVTGCAGNLVESGGFECGVGTEAWDVVGAPGGGLGGILCTTGSCGLLATGPRDGDGWLNFGGLAVATQLDVSQKIVLPFLNEGAVDIRFYLKLVNLRESDSLTVYFDEVPIYQAEMGTLGFATYQPVIRQLLRRTDGGVHTIRFEANMGAGAQEVAIGVDDLCVTVSSLEDRPICPGGEPAVGTQRIFAQPLTGPEGVFKGSASGAFTVPELLSPVVNGVFFNVVHNFGGAARVCLYDGPPNLASSVMLTNFGSYFCGENTVGTSLDRSQICSLLNGEYWLVYEQGGERLSGQILRGESDRTCDDIGEGSLFEGEFEGEGEFVIEGENVVLPCPEICPGNGIDFDGDGLSDNCEACLETSNTVTDTDRDGMPDGYEYENGLNPNDPADAKLDKDDDGISNLLEFIGGSDPCNPLSPAPTRFVAPTGVDVIGGGDAANPWRTINFALQQVAAAEMFPVRIRIAAGAYTENVTLLPGVTLVGPPCDLDDPAFDLSACAAVRGTMIGATGSALENIVLEQAVNSATLLQLNDVAMSIKKSVFLGNAQRQATAIRANGGAVAGTIIEDCDFSSLAKGIDVQDSVPVIRRSSFVAHSGTYIQLRPTEIKQANANGLGSNTNPNSGRNRFAGRGTGELILGAVVNERSEPIAMEANEWGTEDPEEIDALISGPADFEPFLATGAALLAGSLFVTVWDAATQSPVLNASVELQVSPYAPVEENTNGVYPFFSVEDGQYTATVFANGFPSGVAFTSVEPGEIVSVVVALGAGATPPACGCGPEGGNAGWGGGDVLVLLLVLSVLSGASAVRWRRD